MVKRNPAAVLVFYLLTLAMLLAPCGAAAVTAQDILIVHSYHQGFLWTDTVMAGMLDVLQKESPSAQIHVEYLDAKRYPPETFAPVLTETLFRKTSRLKPKVILVSDDAAFDLMLNLRAKFFPGVPLVFCGVNNFKDERLTGQMDVTGVVEDFDIKGTIELILTLHRQVTHLAVISDSTETGAANRDRFRQIASTFAGRLKFLELFDLSTEELFGKLTKLPPDAVILNLSFFRDRLGQSYSTQDGNHMIANHAGRPIYSCWDFYLVGDVVGGYVTSGRQQGEAAASMAAAILKGVGSDDIPILRTSPNAYMFDHKVMERFGIKDSALPKGSIVLNRQVLVWEQYWDLLLGIMVVGSLQMFLILALLTRGKRLRAANFALRESERSFRDLANGGQVLIWTSDENKLCDYFNEPWLHFTGRTLEQELGNGWFEGVHPDDYKHCLEVYVAAFDRRERFSMEYRLRHHSGEYRWILDQGSPRFDCEGVFLGYIGHCLDITEKKRVEHALEQEHNLYKDLVASQPSGVYRLRIKAQKPWGQSEWVGKVESNYKLEMVSDLFCSVLGATREQCEANASLVVESIHPEDRPDFVTRNVHALQSLEPFKWEGRLKVRDKVVWVYFASVPRCLNDGDVIWTGILLDITELKQAEEQLHRHMERLRFALSAARQSWFETIVPTGEISVGHEYPRMLGYEPGEFVSNVQNWYDNIHPDDRANVQRIFRQMLQTGGPEEVEYRRLTCSNEWKWMYTIGAVAERDAAGKPYRLTGIHMDITERKQSEAEKDKLQDQLTQAQKMESVGRLAGGVAHDFNNMLGVIIGHAELALDKIGPDEPSSADLKEIQKAAKRSADLTHQLLAFARKQTVAPKVLDLNDIVENALKMLRRLIGEDIDLAWMPRNNLGRIFIDSSQVDQILTNLCVNARDAIADTGKITVETDNVVLDGEYCARHSDFVSGEYILLAVSDNGCGIDAEMLPHIFEPFYTTKEMGKGTGLGLAMVYGAVKQNNGFINVYSEPGHGTTFKIYLPRHMAKAVSRPQQEQTLAPTAGGETILLVEDEPTILRMTKLMLEKMGHTVIAAGVPGEAIRLAREHKGQINLLMTDVVMPEMNGRDLARNLRPICPDLKRLFMSGYTANVIAHHGVLDEGVHFIQKPFSTKDLQAKLREALGG